MRHVLMVEGDVVVALAALRDAGVVIVDQPLVADHQVERLVLALLGEQSEGQTDRAPTELSPAPVES